MTPRISPASPPDWSPEMTAFINNFRSGVVAHTPEENRQPGTNLLGTLARYPSLSMGFLTFNRHLLSTSALSARQRELLVLRVAAIRQSDYEWAQHVILAERAGIQADEITRIVDGPDAPGWTVFERSLLKSVDELLADGVVSDETWTVLAAEFDDQQLMDVVFTVGCYSMLAMALRSFGVEPEAGLVPFLPKRLAE
ncbi:MAG: carboxymuconolactone decarboxylase family protein [Rhodococcus sp. (in: high G+C Gram-positive bacteria)]|uniref:carboxymuconolactone decarboxylase family protein n=1 Tax=Rhodococcus sp. TaxID=1831 RepID=UPI003BAF5A45